MDIDAHLRSVRPEDAGDLAATAEEMGFAGVWITEETHSPYTLLTRMADATSTIHVGSAIALAFPRSPMVTAYTARDIQSLSDGRLLLGLGTQVKGHIERRFGMQWDSPGPRLREYVQVLKHVWDAWATGTDVDFHGEFYTVDLCPPAFVPETIDNPEIPVYVAAVNEFNVAVAGEVCDGIHVHPLHSPEYISAEVVPNLESGARRAGRDVDDITVATAVMAVTGESETERERARERVREQIAFYASTRTYRNVLDVHGWAEVCDELHELSVTDRWDEMPALVTDEMIDAFAVEAPLCDLRQAIQERYTHVDRVAVYEPFRGEEHWRALVE